MNSITTYGYDRFNGVYTDQVEAYESPLEPGVYLDPAFTCRDAPSEAPVGFIAVRIGDNWRVFPDHRGETWYDKDGQAVIIDRPGVPERLTKEPPVPHQLLVDLTAYAAQKRRQVETSGITIDGMQIATNRESQAMISSAFQVASVTGQAIKFKTSSGFVELSPKQMQGIALTVAAHVQASFAAEADVIAKLNTGEMQSIEQIDAYPWPGK